MAQHTVLVVEDEKTIADAIAARLEKEGFKAEICRDGSAAVDVCLELKPDIVILDLMLPGMDGLEVCRRIQSRASVPVLMLTARDSETDMLVGLGVGADDYMTKPFSPRELVARIRAILRRVERQAQPAEELLRIADIEIDPGRRKVVQGGAEVHLTPIEFDILHLLASRVGFVHSRDSLLSKIWGYSDGGVGSRTVDSHITALRRKLGRDLIRTVHGVGYSLNESK